MAKSRLHDDAMVQFLREDPGFVQHYLHQAFIDIDEDGGQEAFLTALRHVVEARGGMAQIADRAGVSRETLYRTLSPKGNPTLKTLRSVVSATGFQFSQIVAIG
ncbi:putative addiction module antidote protein [Serratia sp. JSRIV001]|uniref:addiction module antidote protein n=1 Tax=unclassified Serratia (in: enterobacteria) TaxID=2647522 RepID=UPI001CBC2B9A|nr:MULTISPECIES: addiction module antidote protein [unclassified Serratia (in: enterobacteria)]UAN43982.1 putative addiction module antidote protein [Serratia sp. JSRIV001]UAN53506.1 putative addiction module antidote protein [Serratia sp. JSRIV002]UAN58127.1 putative addiction module antidote protein [Serratia sp. JSRIV004]